jgi:WD40 repeat protein/serine/threonine protein kinase
MPKPPLDRVEQLFHEAAALGPQERSTFLATQCGGDTKLRAAVEDLLAHDATIERTADVYVSPVLRTEITDTFSDLIIGPALAPSAIAGYEILGELGRGGMGVVYKARQISLNRLVALKMMLSGALATPEQLGRFRTEAEALARLQHSNIVQIYEIAEHDGHPYFAMEYVNGPSLSQTMTGVPWPPRAAAQLIETLARAIFAVHQCGIVHRDLKPANVLLQRKSEIQNSKSEGKGSPSPSDFGFRFSSLNAKITDFGLAKDQTSQRNLTETGQAMGTPCYMAPEQARGDISALGPGTDIYALGVILYELVTGRPPFQGATPLETLHRVVSEEALAPRRLQPRVSRDLETICLKCLEKEPHKRYSTALDLAEDLGRFQAGAPIQARPIGFLGRSWRWCRRRPAVAALIALSAVMAAALVVTALVYNIRLEHALARAEEQVVEMNVTVGMQDLDEGDSLTALLWLTEALRLDKPSEARKHRTRIATALRQCPQLLQLLVFEQPVVAARTNSTDGWVVTADDQGTVQIWDVMAGAPIGPGLTNGTAVVHAALSLDGRLLATANADGTASVWNTVTGKLRFPPMLPGKPLNDVAIHPGGEVMLAHRANSLIELWNLKTGQRIPLEGLSDSGLEYSTFSDDARWVLTVDRDHNARGWNAATGAAIASPLKLDHAVTQAAFSADGRRWALAGADNAIRVWEVSTLKTLGRPLKNPQPVAHVSFSPDGDRIVTVHAGRTAQVWDVLTGELLASAPASEGKVGRASFSPDGRLLATFGSDNRARVWEAATGEAVAPPLKQNGSVRFAEFTPDSKRILVVGKDDCVRLWQLPAKEGSGGRVLDAEPAPPSDLTDAAGRRVIKLPAGDAVQVVDAVTGAPLGPPLRHSSRITHAALSPDGRRVVSASDDNSAEVWDPITGSRLIPPLMHKATVLYAAFSPDGGRVVTSSEDRTARVWDTVSGDALTPALWHPRSVERAYFSPDDNHVITICGDRVVRSWDLTPDMRPVEDLVRLAQVLAGGRIDPDYGLVPLDGAALRSAWQALIAAKAGGP